MRLRHLSVDNYRNLRGTTLQPTEPTFLTAIVGNNGSGKSNLIEAILEIMMSFYFGKAPAFDFRFEFEAQRRSVKLTGQDGSIAAHVDGHRVPIERFKAQLRSGPAQVYFPELTFIYYSGECRRVRKLVGRYNKQFRSLTKRPDTSNHIPLFVESSIEHAEMIALALFAHGHTDLLERVGLGGVINPKLVVQVPHGFDPKVHEPKLWNTEGVVRSVIAAIDDTSTMQKDKMGDRTTARIAGAHESTRTYSFGDDDDVHSVHDLADRLCSIGSNLYLALSHLRARGMLRSVEFQLIVPGRSESFEFDQLSEGVKQLIAVIGGVRLAVRSDNLVLLDEPDTHLNPLWTWHYTEMLSNAFQGVQRDSSTVLMTTHDPVMISGLTREQVLLARTPIGGTSTLVPAQRDPRGQGIANLLCSEEFFGLPSSLDEKTQILMDERLRISIKQELQDGDRKRLIELNRALEIIQPGVSERDPDFVDFLRQRALMEP